MATWTEADLRRLRAAQANRAAPGLALLRASRVRGPAPGGTRTRDRSRAATERSAASPAASRHAVAGAAPSRTALPRRLPAADSAALLPGGGFVLTLRELPPSLNDWQRWHWARRLEETMRIAALVRALAVCVRLPRLGAAEACVRCYFPDRRRRDPTNYAHWKPLWDALVRARLIDDDDAEHLRVAAFDLLVDAERPRSEVEVRPWSPGESAAVAPTP